MAPASTTYEATEVVTDVPKSGPPPPSTWVSIGSIACSAPMARPTSSMSTEAEAKSGGLASLGRPSWR